MAVGDIFEGFFEYVVLGQSFKLKLAMEQTPTGAGAGGQAQAGSAFISDVVPLLQPLFPANVVLGCTYLRKILPAFSTPALNVLQAVEGTASGQVTPLNQTAIVQLRSATPGPQHDGLWQISGLSENHWAQGQLTAAFLAGPGVALTDKLEAELVAPDTSTYDFGVISRIVGGIPRPVPVIGNVFDALFNALARTRPTRVTPLTGSNLL